MQHPRGLRKPPPTLHHPHPWDLITRCTRAQHRQQPTSLCPSFLVTEHSPILALHGQGTQALVNHWTYHPHGRIIIGKLKKKIFNVVETRGKN